ncbi:MAG TPA: hypothetical protein DDW50_02745 [Firmicutes bacterium]|jgi:TRAP-type transport system small permease protein|nr:hypothetical protein [Bacillota bacterium]
MVPIHSAVLTAPKKGDSRVNKFFTALESLLENWCKFLLLVQIVIVAYVVFGRYVLKSTPGWGEASALMAMVWFGLMSASIGLRDDSHIKITFLEKYFSPVLIQWTDRLNLLLIFLFGIFMLVEGFKLTLLTSLNILTGLNIPSSWLYASVPATGLVIMLQTIHKIKDVK